MLSKFAKMIINKTGGLDFSEGVGKQNPSQKTPAVVPSAPGAVSPPASGTVSPTSTSQQTTGDVKQRENIIRGMQFAMSKLQDEVYAKEDVAKTIMGLRKQSGDTIESVQKKINELSAQFGRTAKQKQYTAANLDGVWGSATETALKKIQEFMVYANITGIPAISPDRVKSNDANSISKDIERAENNTRTLELLFQQLGIKFQSGLGGSSQIFDQIKQDLLEEDTRNPLQAQARGNVAVTADNLKDIYSFIYFAVSAELKINGIVPNPEEKNGKIGSSIQSKGTPPTARVGNQEVVDPWTHPSYRKAQKEEVLKSLAELIKSSTIVRLSENKPGWGVRFPDVPEGTNTTKVEETDADEEAGVLADDPYSGADIPDDEYQVAPPTGMSGGVICIAQIDAMLTWFQKRSFFVESYFGIGLNKRDKHPIETNRFITNADVQLARTYRQMVENLIRMWGVVKKALMDDGFTPYQPFSLSDLADLYRLHGWSTYGSGGGIIPGRGGPGYGQSGRYGRGRRGPGGQIIEGLPETTSDPPFGGKYLDMNRLISVFGPSVSRVKPDLVNGIKEYFIQGSIPYNAFTNMEVNTFRRAFTYCKDDNDLALAMQDLSAFLQGVYATWAKRNQPQALIQRQSDFHSLWQQQIWSLQQGAEWKPVYERALPHLRH
jgi:hypothetical protein